MGVSLEMQTLGPYHGSTELESLGVGKQQVDNLSRGFLNTLKFERHYKSWGKKSERTESWGKSFKETLEFHLGHP